MNCELCGKEDTRAIIRTKPVCNKCFKVMRKDNQERQHVGKDIPNTFKILKKTEKRLKNNYSENHLYRKMCWEVE
jgi:ribosome-binding protein aMBF1 (putative translation factor)